MAFTDMMSSSRGPGLIGLALALLILCGFGVLMLLSTDERFLGGEQTIESVIAQQQRDIDGMEAARKEMTKTLDTMSVLRAAGRELEMAKRDKLFASDKAAGIRASMAAARKAIEAKTAEFESYKDKYRASARAQAKGMVIARLETRDGTVYENVTVRDVNAVGMQIAHDGGGRRVAFEQLPDELQDQFQFDPRQKAQTLAKEREQQDAHEASVDTTLAAEKDRADRMREEKAARLREDTIAAIKMKEGRIKSLEFEISDLERSIVAESAKRISNAPQLRARVTDERREMEALRADVTRLAASL